MSPKSSRYFGRQQSISKRGKQARILNKQQSVLKSLKSIGRAKQNDNLEESKSKGSLQSENQPDNLTNQLSEPQFKREAHSLAMFNPYKADDLNETRAFPQLNDSQLQYAGNSLDESSRGLLFEKGNSDGLQSIRRLGYFNQNSGKAIIEDSQEKIMNGRNASETDN